MTADPLARWFETRGVAALLTMRVIYRIPPAKAVFSNRLALSNLM